MLVNGKAFFAQLEKSVNLSKIYLPHRAGEILDCEQSLFSSKIRGEERKTSKRARGVLHYLGYTETCRWIGYGFLASLSSWGIQFDLPLS